MSTNQPAPYIPSPPPGHTSSWALASLICGVLAWLGVFGLGGVAAVVCGHIAKNEIRKSNGNQSGDGLATAGLVLGYINVAIALLGICLAILIIAGAIGTPLICIPFVNMVEGGF